VLRDHEDRHLADAGRQFGAEPDGHAEFLQRVTDGGGVQHDVERAGQATRAGLEGDRARPLAARTAQDVPVQGQLVRGHFLGRQDGKTHRPTGQLTHLSVVSVTE